MRHRPHRGPIAAWAVALLLTGLTGLAALLGAVPAAAGAAGTASAADLPADTPGDSPAGRLDALAEESWQYQIDRSTRRSSRA